MRKKLHRYLAVLLIVIVAVGVYACGEKNTFQVSGIKKEYTNVKIASIDDRGEIILNEKRTQEFWELFEGVTFEQTQSAGGLTEKTYSIVILNGEVPVDSLQISADGTIITYGGYFYRLKEGNFDTEKWQSLLEAQRQEEKENKPETEEGLLESAEEQEESETEPASEEQQAEEQQGTFYIVEKDDFDASKIIAVPAWPECEADLDGDGSMETIVYEVQSADDIHKELLFLVYDSEGNICTQTEGTAPEWENPFLEGYFIMDLDSTDDYLEIAVLDDGPSGDPTFHVIRYDAGKLIYMGGIFTDSPYDELKIKGDGKVTGSGRLSVLQSWRAPFTWVIEAGRLQLLEEEWYYPYVNSYSEVTVRQIAPITVYEEADLEAPATEVQPSGEVVTFGTTDNKNWVQFFRGDGIEGWIYLEDGFLMESGGEKINVMEIFENLNMAG